MFGIANATVSQSRLFFQHSSLFHITLARMLECCLLRSSLRGMPTWLRPFNRFFNLFSFGVHRNGAWVDSKNRSDRVRQYL